MKGLHSRFGHLLLWLKPNKLKLDLLTGWLGYVYVAKTLSTKMGKKMSKLASELTKQEPLDKYIRMNTWTIQHFQLKVKCKTVFKSEREEQQYHDDRLVEHHLLHHLSKVSWKGLFSERRFPSNAFETFFLYWIVSNKEWELIFF